MGPFYNICKKLIPNWAGGIVFRPILHVGMVLCLFRQVFSASEFTLLIARDTVATKCISGYPHFSGSLPDS